MTDLHLSADFPQRLRKFIELKKLTLAEFAERYNLGNSTLNRLLAGKTDRLLPKTLLKLERITRQKSWPTEEVIEYLAPDVPEPAPKEVTVTPSNYDLPASMASPREISRRLRDMVKPKEYKPRDLMFFVVGYPKEMPDDVRKAFKDMIELNLISVYGLASGFCVEFDPTASVYSTTPAYQSPEIRIKERPGKQVYYHLRHFYEAYVADRTHEAILEDGLCILAIEPDQDLDEPLDAWLLKGVVFGSSGIAPANRDISSERVHETPVYTIPLHADVIQSLEVFQQAQKVFREFIKT